MKSWKYYNHALVPATPLGVVPDLNELNDKGIWNENGNKALLARWTTDFDCGYETDWWYCIKEAPYNYDELSKSARKHIRQALRKVKVSIIDPIPYAKEIYRVYTEAIEDYKNFKNTTNINDFIASVEKDKRTYWAAFNIETNEMVAYMIVGEKATYVDLYTAKFSKKFLNLQASTAMYNDVLEYYLNKRNFNYVNSGERNINHQTNTQAYKIATFGYRKVYCKLHVIYNPKYKFLIKIAYHFRWLLSCLDKINIIHKINAVLKMEEISRKARKDNE